MCDDTFNCNNKIYSMKCGVRHKWVWGHKFSAFCATNVCFAVFFRVVRSKIQDIFPRPQNIQNFFCRSRCHFFKKLHKKIFFRMQTFFLRFFDDIERIKTKSRKKFICWFGQRNPDSWVVCVRGEIVVLAVTTWGGLARYYSVGGSSGGITFFR